MIIKLQEDQIGLFWNLIKKSMIESNDIPLEFQQDYGIHKLTKLLSGSLQAWICYEVIDGQKHIKFVLVTSILDEKYHGIRVLNVEAIYGFRLVALDDITELYSGLEEFAKANKCNAVAADYSIPRVKEFLMHLGFEEHRTVCRKFI